jgi:hypothetical protein
VKKMPDRLMRVSESMRARSWSPWFSVTGTLKLTGAVPVVLPAAMVCESTGVPFWVMVKRTSSVVTFGLTMVPEIVPLPAAGIETGNARPPKAKSAEAVNAYSGRPLSSSVAGLTVAPFTVR